MMTNKSPPKELYKSYLDASQRTLKSYLCSKMVTLVATPLIFDSLRGKSFILSYKDPTHLICIDSDARYPMFRDSYMWTALTVLTKLFSEFDGTTTIFNFMLSRILHLLEPAASKQLRVEKPHLTTL